MHKSTMYRQGWGWIVSTWDEGRASYCLSSELPYHVARAQVGAANCRRGARCRVPCHHERHEADRTAREEADAGEE